MFRPCWLVLAFAVVGCSAASGEPAPGDHDATALLRVPVGNRGGVELSADRAGVYVVDHAAGSVTALRASDGASRLVARSKVASGRLVSDGERIYWTACETNQIFWASVGGNEGGLLASAPVRDAESPLIVDDQHLYFVGYDKNPLKAALMRVAKDGGAVETMASLSSGTNLDTSCGDFALAADEGHVYVVENCESKNSGRYAQVESLAKDTMARRRLASIAGKIGQVQADDESVFFTVVERDGGEGASAEIRTVAHDGSREKAFATGLGTPRAMALGTKDVYWEEGGAVRAMPKAGGVARTVIAHESVATFALGNGRIYWASTHFEGPDVVSYVRMQAE